MAVKLQRLLQQCQNESNNGIIINLIIKPEANTIKAVTIEAFKTIPM